jgi:hypothetical protein
MPHRIHLQKDTYRIRFTGGLNRSVTDWLGEASLVSQEKGETLITAKFSDQAALRGFLDQLWNLNCTVLSMERIDE